MTDPNYDLYDPMDPDVVATDQGGNVTSITLDGWIDMFVRPDGSNAFLRFTWHGRERKHQHHQIMLGGHGAPDKNWCILPSIEDFPDMSMLFLGVDPATCNFTDVDAQTGELVREPGQTFRVTGSNKKGDPCRWPYTPGVRAYAVVETEAI